MNLQENFNTPRKSFLKRKTPVFFVTKHKILFTSLFVISILFFVVSLLSFNLFGDLNSRIQYINDWINHHKSLVILWHILLLTSIYISWGIKVDKEAKRKNLSLEKAKKAKRFRWVIISAIIFIDMLVYI